MVNSHTLVGEWLCHTNSSNSEVSTDIYIEKNFNISDTTYDVKVEFVVEFKEKFYAYMLLAHTYEYKLIEARLETKLLHYKIEKLEDTNGYFSTEFLDSINNKQVTNYLYVDKIKESIIRFSHTDGKEAYLCNSK